MGIKICHLLYVIKLFVLCNVIHFFSYLFTVCIKIYNLAMLFVSMTYIHLVVTT